MQQSPPPNEDDDEEESGRVARVDSIFLTHEHEALGKGPHHNKALDDEVHKFTMGQNRKNTE